MNTELFAAIDKKHIDIVKSLLANGVDINEKDDFGWTALMWAAFKGDRETVKLLINHGADVNIKTFFGTAQTLAKGKGHAKIVALIEKARVWH
jgi:ankyrin repeat protein